MFEWIIKIYRPGLVCHLLHSLFPFLQQPLLRRNLEIPFSFLCPSLQFSFSLLLLVANPLWLEWWWMCPLLQALVGEDDVEPLHQASPPRNQIAPTVCHLSWPSTFPQMKTCLIMTLFYTGFRTKMKYLLFFIISGGTGCCQDNFVRYLSMLSLQARGASVMSSLFRTVLKGMHGNFAGVWRPRLTSSPDVFTSKGHINRVKPVSECL